jgi:ketosteroid isomerase-like protein
VSAADVEAVRRLYAAFNEGDYEAATAMLHEEAELHQAPEVPDADSYYGREEFLRGMVRWLAGFEPGFQYEPVEMRAVGDRVFSRLILRGRGRDSGIEIEREGFNVWEVRDGKPSRCFAHFDELPARRRAGLPDR